MSSELDRRYDEMLARVRGAGGPLTIGRDERGRAIECPIYEALAPLLAGVGEHTMFPGIAPQADAAILFTSGSTGESKGGVSTDRALTAGIGGVDQRLIEVPVVVARLKNAGEADEAELRRQLKAWYAR